MRKSVVFPFACVTFLTVGCTKQPESAQDAVTVSRSEPTLNRTQSTRDATHSPKTQDFQPRPTALVIDVAPTSEIRGVVRSVFQDSRGTLWIGGECDLFRNDGTTLTSYDIRDDLGRGVTIKQIVEDKAGNIWCGTEGGLTRIDGKSFTSFGEQHGLISRNVWSMAVDGSGEKQNFAGNGLTLARFNLEWLTDGRDSPK